MFAQILRQLREDKGLTQEQLASVLGLSQQTIDHYEKKRVSPKIDTVQKIAQYFNVTVDYLLGRTDAPHGDGYYSDPEAAAYAQQIFDDPKLKILFDASKKLTKEDIDFVVKMVQKMQPKDDDHD